MNTSVQGAIKRTSVTLDNFKFTSIIIFSEEYKNTKLK